MGLTAFAPHTVLPGHGTGRAALGEVQPSSADPEVLETLRRWYLLGRVVEPVDIARAVGFLASDAASAITGVALPVDCGANLEAIPRMSIDPRSTP